MARVALRDRLNRGLLLLDGAMGTELIARGAAAGKCNDYLNIESPNTVLAVHQAYIRAGSDVVLTNTFGANRYALARHALAGELERVNMAGALVARRAAGDDNYILGDIGPSGEFLEPVGSLKVDELKAAFGQQATALVAGGIDGLIIETMTALDELTAAIEAVKSVCGDLPVFASMSFDRTGSGFRTMMGVDVASAVSRMASLGADAVGFNCGSASLVEYVELAQRFVGEAQQIGREVTLFAEPNAGKPELIDEKTVYAVSPADFAAAVQKIYSAGVRTIGGCCGTGPAHIAAVSRLLRK